MDKTEYHRTFLRYTQHPSLTLYNCPVGSCHDATQKPRSPNSRWSTEFDPLPGFKPSPFVGGFGVAQMRTPAPRPPQRQFNALKWNGDGIPERLVVFEKPDQRFIDTATPWELRWSAICQHGGRFHPVVNEELMLFGHAGFVHGDELISVDGANHATIEEILEDFPVYVADRRDRLPEGWNFVGMQVNRYRVIALPNGQVVLAAHVSTANSAEPSLLSPTDFIGFASLGAKVGGGLIGLIRKAGARGYRALAVPTKAVADNFKKKVAEWQAKRAAKKAAIGAKTFLTEREAVLAVIQDGKIVARTPATGVLSHEDFVGRALGPNAVRRTRNGLRLAPPNEGAEVVTIGKHGKDGVYVMRSGTFHDRALPASQAAQDAAKREYH